MILPVVNHPKTSYGLTCTKKYANCKQQIEMYFINTLLLSFCLYIAFSLKRNTRTCTCTRYQVQYLYVLVQVRGSKISVGRSRTKKKVTCHVLVRKRSTKCAFPIMITEVVDHKWLNCVLELSTKYIFSMWLHEVVKHKVIEVHIRLYVRKITLLWKYQLDTKTIANFYVLQ